MVLIYGVQEAHGRRVDEERAHNVNYEGGSARSRSRSRALSNDVGVVGSF